MWWGLARGPPEPRGPAPKLQSLQGRLFCHCSGIIIHIDDSESNGDYVTLLACTACDRRVPVAASLRDDVVQQVTWICWTLPRHALRRRPQVGQHTLAKSLM